MATDRGEKFYAARWSPFEVLDLRLGPGPTGHGELAGVEHLDLLTAGTGSRLALRLARSWRRRFPRLPITGETADARALRCSATADSE
jgi:hypothetical protein